MFDTGYNPSCFADKAGTQVAFHAILSKAVTTTKEQTLICDDVYTNVGSGYSSQTGVFTAPVAGTYCFMATASPNEADNDKNAKLAIVLENVMKGYMFSSGYSWSTGHTVIKVSAGQKVWLRTYSGGEYTFDDGWWTTFSGMLLQPDLWSSDQWMTEGWHRECLLWFWGDLFVLCKMLRNLGTVIQGHYGDTNG